MRQMKARTFAYRLWEMVPALLTWFILGGLVIFSLIAPVVTASLVLVYAIYWSAKTVLMSVHLIYSFRAYRRAIRIDWSKRLADDPVTRNRWREIFHLVIIANAKEPWPIVKATLEALRTSTYPLDHLLVVLATEERCPVPGQENAKRFLAEYGPVFGGAYVTVHPAHLPNEVIGKGANITFAAKTIVAQLTGQTYNLDKILVTTLDADNRVHRDYLAALTQTFLRAPHPHLTSYQPLPMYFNNIWAVPMIIRSISVGSSFWQMIEATRPYRLRNFSAHSQSLPLLEQSDYWSKTTIVEDGHQYWRSFFATAGRHRVVPIFVPIYQDAVLSPDGHLMTYREQYLQKRRWAWGVSDIPFVITNMWAKRRTLPPASWIQAVRLIEGHVTWAVTSLVLAIFGWLPTLLNPAFRETVFAYHFIRLYHFLLTFAMVGMIVSLVISRLLLPARPKIELHSNDLVEWLLAPFLLPLANIFFGSLAAVDAQTRLALGAYLDFKPTAKAVDRQALPVHH